LACLKLSAEHVDYEFVSEASFAEVEVTLKFFDHFIKYVGNQVRLHA
jgi:hypothetical protein